MLDLNSEWKYYQLSSGSEQNQKSWADAIKMVGAVKTIPELLYTLDEIEKVGLENLNDIHFFKGDVMPMWEHPVNVNGGRCIFELPISGKEFILEAWKKTTAFCSSNIFETISGCVFSEKASFRISIWISDPRESDDIINAWKELLKGIFGSFSFSLHNKYGDYNKNKRRGNNSYNKNK